VPIAPERRKPLKGRAQALHSSIMMRDDGRDLCILFAGGIEGHLGLRLRAEEARRSLHRNLGPWNLNDAAWELMLPSGTSLMFVEGGRSSKAGLPTRPKH
jgi:hypothetical protein